MMKKLLGLILVCSMLVGCGGLFVGCDSDPDEMNSTVTTDPEMWVYAVKRAQFERQNGRKPTDDEAAAMMREAERELEGYDGYEDWLWNHD